MPAIHTCTLHMHMHTAATALAFWCDAVGVDASRGSCPAAATLHHDQTPTKAEADIAREDISATSSTVQLVTSWTASTISS